MDAMPRWLKRYAARRAEMSKARGPRACRPSDPDPLERRTFPGGGIVPLSILPGWVQQVQQGQPRPAATTAKSPQARPTTPAAPQATSTQGAVAAKAQPTRATPQAASPTPRATGSTAPLAVAPQLPPPARQAAPAGNRASQSSSPPSPPPSSSYRPISEVGNNVASPNLGTAGTDLLRVSPAAYADGISAPSLPNNPGPRVLSDLLNNQADPTHPSQDVNTYDAASLSDFGYAFGQFIDHDLDLTPTDPNQTLQILADPNDPSRMGNQTFERSVSDPATGTSTSNPRQQVNAVTSFLDLSQVYGSTAAVASALRSGSGGLLKTSPGNMLPYDNSTYLTPAQLAVIDMANDAGAVSTRNLFVTGDVRGNENVELTALQTLFLRNHNTIAGELHAEHPG